RELSREFLDVGAIAQGRHGPTAAGSASTAPTAITAAAGASAATWSAIGPTGAAAAGARLTRLLLADDEHSFLGEMDFVDGDPTGRQEVTHGFGQGHLGEGDGIRLIGLGQAEQGRGLVVVEDEAPGAVDEDEALAQRVQSRIVEREQPLELLGPVAERDPAQIAGQQPGPQAAEGDGGDCDDDDLRQ